MKLKKDLIYFFIVPLIFLLAFSFIATNKPIGDFGNYYYGSTLWKEGKNPMQLYGDIHWFNEEILKHGENNFFENYSPVPPFSLIFYYPFSFLESASAKLLFNILSCLVFCFSFFRFAKKQNLEPKYLFLLPVLFLPMYNNFMQGQSYLLIVAALLEIWLAYNSGRQWLVAIIIAFVFQLKLFPAFVLIYFLFRKEYKIILFSVLGILVLTGLTAIVLGENVVLHYFTDIVPRLMKNEVIDPFYYGHQSLNIFLNDLFRYDELSNRNVLINAPYLIGITEGIIGAYVLYNLFALRKNNGFKIFAFFIFCSVFLSRYVTSYSLILLLPLIVSVFEYKRSVIMIALLLVACNVPMNMVSEIPFVLKYFRIILLCIVFALTVLELKPKTNYVAIILCGVVFVSFNLFSGKRGDNHYFITDNKPGVLYDINVHEKVVTVSRCMGEKDFTDTIPFPYSVTSARQEWPFNDRDAFRFYTINDSILLYLSDFQQGIGMNKLRMEIYKP
ncbi:MAG: hypothetical protein K0S32_3922 [Bacteroidetes bacterium]|jgi:hypothetical protein|nr:hypothetical protein [Bacteroidota bacterium]